MSGNQHWSTSWPIVKNLPKHPKSQEKHNSSIFFSSTKHGCSWTFLVMATQSKARRPNFNGLTRCKNIWLKKNLSKMSSSLSMATSHLKKLISWWSKHFINQTFPFPSSSPKLTKQQAKNSAPISKHSKHFWHKKILSYQPSSSLQATKNKD